MKIIHSADWHLGQTLYGYDRLDDQAAALRHIGAIIEREQPDAVIAAGDIFDSSQPSAAAQRLLSETLAEWHRLSQATRMVITAGNHDSASRHEVFRTPWILAGVEAIGIIPPAEDFGAVARKLIVRIDGKGWIIALPFAGRRLNAEPELVAKLLERVAAMNSEGLPVVLSAHLPVADADFSANPRFSHDNIVGNVETVSLATLGEGYDYLALGHIHSCQSLGKDGRAWYSGTPLHTSFDESGPRTVNIVTIGAHGELPEVRREVIPEPSCLRTLPDEGYAPWDEALELLAGFPAGDNSFVRLNVAQEEPLPPDAMARAYRAVADKACRFCNINYKCTATADTGPQSRMSVASFIEAQPAEIARMYFDMRGIELSDRRRRLLDRVIAEACNSEETESEP